MTPLLSVGFRVWVAAATLSQVGDAVLYFALGWAASGFGGAATGLVLSAVTVPRTLLMLFGGAVADRVGSRNVMLVADSTLLVGSVGAAVLVVTVGTPLWLLVAIALVLGVVSSFHNPATGAFPASIVERPALPRALALRHAGFHAASLTGGPIGGVLVAAGGMALALGANAVSFLLVLAVLLVLRPAERPAPVADAVPVADAGRASVLREIGHGLRVAVRVPALRILMVLYAAGGGLVLPLGLLVVPLLARERGWDAVQAGFVIGAIGVGALAGALVTARTGTHRQVGPAAGAGLLGSALGAVGLAIAPTAAVGVGAGVVIGVGVAAFVAHASPLVLTSSPDDCRGRIQSMLGVVQSASLVGTNVVLGVIATAAGAGVASSVAAGGLLAAAVAAGVSPALRAHEQHGGGGRESNPPGRDARPRRC